MTSVLVSEFITETLLAKKNGLEFNLIWSRLFLTSFRFMEVEGETSVVQTDVQTNTGVFVLV